MENPVEHILGESKVRAIGRAELPQRIFQRLYAKDWWENLHWLAELKKNQGDQLSGANPVAEFKVTWVLLKCFLVWMLKLMSVHKLFPSHFCSTCGVAHTTAPKVACSLGLFPDVPTLLHRMRFWEILDLMPWCLLLCSSFFPCFPPPNPRHISSKTKLSSRKLLPSQFFFDFQVYLGQWFSNFHAYLHHLEGL